MGNDFSQDVDLLIGWNNPDLDFEGCPADWGSLAGRGMLVDLFVDFRT